MVFLINASNLRQGGGVQVAQSICGQLSRLPSFRFVVVLSNSILLPESDLGKNVEVIRYDMPKSISSTLFGRCRFLDDLVRSRAVDAVLTVFGPSRWRPRVPHLCGFARGQLVLTDSPYYKRLTLREKLLYKVWTWSFKKSSDTFYTENEYISRLLPGLLGQSIKVYTVTNYYNQVFDMPDQWRRDVELPPFDGETCLSVSSYYPHKNFEIIQDVVRTLRHDHPGFKVRFVLTFTEAEMPVPADIRDAFLFVGKVDVSECPNLYAQSDIMFMPSLVECFSATYPEAMRMSVPIVTTDLPFAKGLCGDAACYYRAVDVQSAADAIYKVATDKAYASLLAEKGKEQLTKYDNYVQRVEKLVGILEEMAKA